MRIKYRLRFLFGIVTFLCFYLAAYRFLLEPVLCIDASFGKVTECYLVPGFRWGGRVSECVFAPATLADRLIRPDVWAHW